MKSRVLLTALIASVAVLAPTACQAGLFDCLNPAPEAPANYAPLYQTQRVAWMPTAAACDPCAAPQVTYVPEVKYRWKYSRIERTEYQPVAACDPCTGCPTTSYRPITKKSLLPWLHREAYTTYKAVPVGGINPVSYAQPTAYNPCATTCDPCGTVCDPCGMSAPSLGSSCATCAPASSSSMDPGYPRQTFGEESDWEPKQQETLKPEEDSEVNKTDGQTTDVPRMPKLVIPTGRTASAKRVRTVSYEAAAPAETKLDLHDETMDVTSLRLVPIQQGQ